MITAISGINSVNITQLRIVGLGAGSSGAISDAIESLIRSWNVEWENKSVQFVALGESLDFHYLNFCKSLCMKKLCGVLQYYNTMDYSPFGYLRSEGGSGSSKRQLLQAALSAAELQNVPEIHQLLLDVLLQQRGAATDDD
jgi:hypothetical protein